MNDWTEPASAQIAARRALPGEDPAPRRGPWRRAGRALAATLALAALAGCGSLTSGGIDPATVAEAPPGLDAAVDAWARPLVDQGLTPGLEVGLLLPDGSTRFYGYGTTRHDGGHCPDADTLFAVGSLSKGFLGGITATMVADGTLSWPDQLASLLPPGTPLSPDAARITVEQLATHDSGLPRQPVTPEILLRFIDYLFTGDNFYRSLDRGEVLSYLADFSAPDPVEPRYSNIGYALLGEVVSARAGESLDQILAERITGPLGLTHTGYRAEILPGYERRAIGHAGDQPKFIARGEPVPDWRFTEILRGAAALYSSAHDLLAFAAAHLDPAGPPPRPSLAETLRVRVARPREAAAVAWVANDIGGLHILYQVGLVAGYTGYLGVDPEHHTAVVVLQNAFNWDYSLGHSLLALLARPTAVAAPPPPPPLTPTQPG